MSEEKNNSTPVANPGGSNQAPEDALADKLAEQADAVTSGLRDLLPDSKAIGIEEARPVATEVETALPSDETRGEPLVADEPAAAASMPMEPTVESADGGKSESAAAGEAAATQPVCRARWRPRQSGRRSSPAATIASCRRWPG